MAEGFIKLWRSCMDSQSWKNHKQWRLWTWCLMMAEFNETDKQIRKYTVHLMPGEFACTLNDASESTGLTLQEIRTQLQNLQGNMQINIKTTNKYSIISIVNWNKYQVKSTSTSTNKSTNKGDLLSLLSKKNKKKDIISLPDFINKETWDAFLEVRKKKKNPNTTHSLELMVKKLERLKGEGYDVNALMEHAILRGWQDVVFDGNPIIPKPAPKPKVTDIKVLLAEQAKRDAERLEKEELANG